MFFLILLEYVSCFPYFDINSSILAPMKVSGKNIGKVGHYSTRGSTLPFKTFVRLNSFTGTDDFGGVCGIKKNMYENWAIDMSFSKVKSCSNCSRKNTFFYTKELCPEKMRMFSGFSVSFESNNTEDVSVLFSLNGTKKYTNLCIAKINDNSDNLNFVINYTDGRVQVTFNNNNKQVLCGTTFNIDIIDGYHSLLSETTGEIKYNDLKYFVILPQSEKKDNPLELEEETKNSRKLIKSLSRKLQKKMQIMSHPSSTFYLKQLQKLNRTLQGVASGKEIKQAFYEIKEQINKAGAGLSVSDLKSFIEDTVDKKMQMSNKKLEMSAQTINEFRAGFVRLYGQTVSALRNISFDISLMMEEVKEEVEKFIQTLPSKRNCLNNEMIEKETEKKKEIRFTKILIIICEFETIFYCCFFLYKKKETNDFKKYD